MDDLNDHDLAQLRSHDPASGSAASAELRARVNGIADGRSVVAIPSRRTAPRWLVPVAAAAAVVIGFGGGVVIGTGGLPPVPSGPSIALETASNDDPAPGISLGTGSGSDAGSAGESGGGPSVGFQNGTDNSALPGVTGQSADSVWGWGWGWGGGDRRFIVPEIDGSPGTAEVYAVDGSTRFSIDDAAAIAAALGVPGSPRATEGYGGWVVGGEAPSTPTLWMSPSGAGDIGYSTGIADPWSICWGALRPQYPSDETGDAEFYPAVEQCVKDTPLPDEASVREALQVFLVALGIDGLDVEIEVLTEEYSPIMTATASRVVDGSVTALSASVTASSAGVLSGYGSAGAVVSLGSYEIVSANEAAARLNSSAFAPTGVDWADTTFPGGDWTPMMTPPPVPEAGSAVPWAIAEYEIASARLGLALTFGPDDTRYLVPAYEFTDTDGNVWSVIALAESELETAP
jgi:hypothetical protein